MDESEGLPRVRPIPNPPIIPSYLYLQFLVLVFLTINSNHPVNFPCERRPENPEKPHDFRQSVEELFPRAIRCSIQGSNPWPQWWAIYIYIYYYYIYIYILLLLLYILLQYTVCIYIYIYYCYILLLLLYILLLLHLLHLLCTYCNEFIGIVHHRY